MLRVFISAHFLSGLAPAATLPHMIRSDVTHRMRPLAVSRFRLSDNQQHWLARASGC